MLRGSPTSGGGLRSAEARADGGGVGRRRRRPEIEVEVGRTVVGLEYSDGMPRQPYEQPGQKSTWPPCPPHRAYRAAEKRPTRASFYRACANKNLGTYNYYLV
jgi:hypothetical protein